MTTPETDGAMGADRGDRGGPVSPSEVRELRAQLEAAQASKAAADLPGGPRLSPKDQFVFKLGSDAPDPVITTADLAAYMAAVEDRLNALNQRVFEASGRVFEAEEASRAYGQDARRRLGVIEQLIRRLPIWEAQVARRTGLADGIALLQHLRAPEVPGDFVPDAPSEEAVADVLVEHGISRHEPVTANETRLAAALVRQAQAFTEHEIKFSYRNGWENAIEAAVRALADRFEAMGRSHEEPPAAVAARSHVRKELEAKMHALLDDLETVPLPDGPSPPPATKE